MPPVNAAGELPEDVELRGTIQIKIGLIADNPRGGERRDVTVKVSEGLGVFRARVAQICQNLALPNEFIIYSKRTKQAIQSTFVPLNEDNFAEVLRSRWSRISQHEVNRWTSEDSTPAESFQFEFFVYKPRQQRAPVSTIRRATARGIARARQRIQQYMEENNVEIGEIELQHLAVMNARRPEGSALEIPRDNTTLQARRIDRERRQLQDQNDEAEAQRNNNLQPLRVVISGTMVELQVDVRSLRTALGLPQHNLFWDGVFNEYNHERIPEDQDGEDVDHQQQE